MDNTAAYDVLIIGAGPIGLACGIEAQQAGLSFVIVEKGCLVNSLYNYPLNMTFFSTSEKLEIGDVPFISDNPKPKRPEALEYYRRVAQKFALNLRLYETVQTVEKQEAGFSVKTSKARYHARFVIVATGFYDIPALMNVPGEELPKVMHYYREPHAYAGQRVLVVGASNSSVDAALETWRKGAEVTLVARGSGIGERVKYWVRPDIENRIAEGCIRAYFNSNVIRIRENEVDVQTPEGLRTIPNDFVLALTGYQPDFAFLERLGIKLSADLKRYPQHDPKTMETNVKGLYLAGVVCGGMDTHLWFIENSREHAVQIMKHIRTQEK